MQLIELEGCRLAPEIALLRERALIKSELLMLAIHPLLISLKTLMRIILIVFTSHI